MANKRKFVLLEVTLLDTEGKRSTFMWQPDTSQTLIEALESLIESEALFDTPKNKEVKDG
jgi:hypothetical protein